MEDARARDTAEFGRTGHRRQSRAWTGTLPATSSPVTANWRTIYSRILWITDLAIIIVVVYASQLFWLGTNDSTVVIDSSTHLPTISYWLFSGVLVLLWALALSLSDSRNARVMGFGATEYIRVTDSSLRVFGGIAIVAFLLKAEVARGFLLISLPFGVVALVLGRWLWRRWLIRQRRRGEYCARVLLVGSARSAADTAAELRRQPEAGYRVVGACLPGAKTGSTLPGTTIPVLGDVDAVERAMSLAYADTVVVTSADDLPANRVKQISWGLESGRQHLVIAPSIADIAGPRIHARPVAGLPLIHVETPRFSKGQLFVKRMLDLFGGTMALLVFSPLMLILIVAVRVSSPGPVFFRQVRIGHKGREFTMVKFRTMVANAEDLLAELAQAERDSGNSVMFKMKHDPRVTRVGRVMRRFSLDELPQLFNVIGGSMSLVGPRPPLPSEVEQYADHVHRRFLVKPGITGLWQVSGRSALSWDETVRLDLSYVENWSLLNDLIILARTVKIVLIPGDTAH